MPRRVARRVVTVIVGVIIVLFLLAQTVLAVGAQQVGTRSLSQGSADETIVVNGKRYQLDHDLVTFLILGFDGRNKNGMNGQTDVFMVAVMNKRTGAMKIITVPRDSIVDAPYYVGDIMLEKRVRLPICLTYAFAGGGQFGAKTASETVSKVLGGVPIPFYYMINYKGMADINDAIGGVTLTPIQSVPDTPIEQGKEITLKGWLAERYVRWRDHETLQSPMDRQKREMHYANAFMAQAKRKVVRDPATVVRVLKAAGKWSMTNTDLNTLTYYGSLAIRGDMSNLDVETLPGQLVKNGEYAEFHLDSAGVRKIVVNTFYKPAE